MALGPLVLGDGFTCSVCSNPQQHGSSISIRSGVGDWPPPRCQNYKDDVAKIQAALNRFSPAEGGPTPPLKADGIIGPKTKAAIYQFQRKWNLTPDNSDKADGVVDVKGYTLQRLSGGPGRPIDLPTEFATRIPRALEIITATRAAMMLARNYFQRPNNGGPFPSLNSIGKQQADRLDRHFRIRQTANPIRRIDEIEAVYLQMQRAIGYIPVNFIVEEPANIAVGAYMFVFWGGFYRRNPNDNWNGLHKGKLYLCARARTLGEEAFAYSIIHELAHYVGPMVESYNTGGIDDHAYYHRNPAKFESLNSELRFRNADNYSQYAFDVIGKPGFNLYQ